MSQPSSLVEGKLARDLIFTDNAAHVELSRTEFVLADNSKRLVPGTDMVTGGHTGPRGAKCLLIAERAGWRLVDVEKQRYFVNASK